MNIIDLLAVISLTILGLCFLILLIVLIPLISQMQRLIAKLEEILNILHKEIMPNFSEFSNIFGQAGKFANNSKIASTKLFASIRAYKEGIKTALKTYFSKNKGENI